MLSIEAGDKVTVKDNVDFTRAITTDARNNQKAIGLASNGVIDFAGYAKGVYTLDVVVDDDRAYEAIIVIGGQTQESVKSVNKEVTFQIYSGNYTGGGGSGNITSSGSGGGSNMTENGNFAGSGGDGGSNMTQGITEFATVPEQPEPINEVFCVPEETLVDGKCVLNPLVWEPEPEPVIGECFDGATPVDGKCPNPTGEPACQALGCPGSPPDPGYEPLVPPEEAVVPQPVFEEVEDQDIDETELDEEKTGEDDEVEVEETVEEDTEEVEESEEDESGESEDEAEDEGSEQESEGESEEESGGGN